MDTPSRREHLEALVTTIRDLVPERDLEKLLERVIAESIRILGADRSLLFLIDRKSDSLDFKYGINLEQGLIEEAHEFSFSALKQAVKGEVIMTMDVLEDERFASSESIIEHNIKTILCAPLFSEENLIGVIYADTRGKTTLLDEDRKSYFLSFVELVTSVIARDLELCEQRDELTFLKRKLIDETIFPEIVGRSSSMKRVKDKVLKIASVDYPISVLITGESGSGKELIARAIYEAGSRATKPFVTVNCAAIPATLMESELFGHEKGAFTGAHARKQGFFEHADGGVLFLDEIGDLTAELQPKLLRVLQFGTFTRLGGRQVISSDVQVLCATSKDLVREMEAGTFRKALFHRLAVEVIHVPPLRERRQDVLLLANHFMKYFSEKMGKALGGIDVKAQKRLTNHDYRENNVRELKNVIERAVLNARGKRISDRDIVFSDDLLFPGEVPVNARPSGAAGEGELLFLSEREIEKLFAETSGRSKRSKREKPFYRVLDQMEKKLILLSLRRSNWKIRPAAKLLGIDPLNLRSKMQALLGELLDEAGGDIGKAARTHRIPSSFLEARLEQAGRREKTRKR